MDGQSRVEEKEVDGSFEKQFHEYLLRIATKDEVKAVVALHNHHRSFLFHSLT